MYVKVILLFLLNIHLIFSLHSQCPEEIAIYHQHQVDSFSIKYPNCHQVNELFIYLTQDLQNLKGLQVLNGHQKSISIYAYERENFSFEGLHNIDTIDYFGITKSKSTFGLKGIEHIKYLFFQNENNFDLSGFSDLSSIDLCALNAPSFENSPMFDLLQFPSVKKINSLNIKGNFLLTGIDRIQRINKLNLTSNYVLKDLQELKTRNSLSELFLTAVWTDFDFSGMENIEFLDLLNVRNGKTIVSLNGLRNIKSIGNIYFDNIKQFAPNNFEELSSITDIRVLYMQNVNGLNSLSGLPPSDTLFEIILKNNTDLTDISALHGVKSIFYKKDSKWKSEAGLEISNNPQLSACSIFPVCQMLKSYPDSLTIIKNNEVGCNNELEILDACLSYTNDNQSDDQNLFPNPFHEKIKLPDDSKVLDIQNIYGHRISILQDDNQLDLKNNMQGVYFIKTKLKSGKLKTFKVIKF